MRRQPQPAIVRIAAQLPRGQDGYWQIIVGLDRGGPWSALDVAREVPHRHRTALDEFIRRLVTAGIATSIDPKKALATGQHLKLYRLTKRPSQLPPLARDGSERPLPVHQRMWSAIRVLKDFSRRELAFAASADKPVPSATVSAYVKHLLTVGYLTENQGLLRLKPRMNTGPKAPVVLRLHAVFDANKNEVIAPPQPVEAEVVS